jgi:hypothetical protein
MEQFIEGACAAPWPDRARRSSARLSYSTSAAIPAKDADKLWRFTASGVRICRRWVGQEPGVFMDYVESKIAGWMLTPHGATMARTILATTRRR